MPSLMPWTCPACGIQIRHSRGEELPRTDRPYRCHVCRLELVIDERTNTLTVPPSADRDTLVHEQRRKSDR